jgi:branched-chain amino acid transport system ATP-binding protein
MLRLNKVNFSYGRLQVLWDISLQADDRQITAIIGGNGAGKTTILKTIIGLLKPSSGEIEFNNERIDSQPTNRIVAKGISYTPQERWLFSRMTVNENLQLGAYLKGPRHDLQKTLLDVYELFPVLKSRGTQMAGTLSGGERQMLIIGRALMSKPKLLMLDEPSFGLAPLVVEKMFDTVRRLQEKKLSILIVEQNVEKTLEIADRAYLLESGNIVTTGTGIELLKSERIKKAYLGI